MIEYADLIDSIRLDEVLNALGIDITQITKSEHWSSCPLPSHPGADASPSFSINEETLLYNCFICGGGALPSLVREIEGFDDDLESTAREKAVEWLLPYSDGDVDTDEGYMKQLGRFLERAEERPKRTRGTTLPFYSPKVIERLTEAPVAMFAKWNIREQATIDHFQIKYEEARLRLSPKGEYVGPALVIPHFFGGKLVGYQERWLDEARGKYPPKYTNSDDFPRKQTLFGWDSAVEEARRGTPVSVVESVMTRVRLWELGYPAVATFGASVSDEQLRLLRSLPAGVILSGDNDVAGERSLVQTANDLTDYIPVSILPPVAKEKGDLADLLDDEVHELFGRVKPVFSALANPKEGRHRE